MKRATSVLLSLIFVFSGFFGIFSAISKMDESALQSGRVTPIARNVNNDSYNKYSNGLNLTPVLETAAAYGGRIKSYASESVYFADMEAKQKAVENKVNSAVLKTFEPVRQSITVIDYLTKQPIQNAIVRIDGVPRYTPKNGIVTVDLSKRYTELYVEKTEKKAGIDEYIPHIEYIEASSETANRVIQLKRASDDLVLSAVNLIISPETEESETINLLTGSYNFAYDFIDYSVTIAAFANVDIDTAILYKNGEIDRITPSNDFLYFDYDERLKDENGNVLKDKNGKEIRRYNEGDRFSFRFIYNGVESKEYDLDLHFIDVDNKVKDPEITIDDAEGGADSIGNDDDGGSKDKGMFGKFTVNVNDIFDVFKIKDKIRDHMGKGPFDERNKPDAKIKLTMSFDPRTGILEISFGIAVSKTIKEKTKQTDLITNKKDYDKVKSELKELKEQEQNFTNDLKVAEENLRKVKEDRDNYIKQFGDDKSEALKKKDEAKEKAWEECRASRADREEKRGRYTKEQTAEREGKIKAADDDYNETVRQGQKEFKTILDQLSGAVQNVDNVKDQIKKLDDLTKMKGGSGLQSTKLKIDFDFEFLANIKFDVYNCFTIVGVNFHVEFKISVKYSWQFFVAFVPVYVAISGSVALRLTVYIYDEDERDVRPTSFMDIIYNMTLKLTIILRGDVGVGFADIIGVGGFAKLELEFVWEISDNRPEAERDYYGKKSYGQLTFTIGFRVKVLFFEYEYEWPNDANGGDWNKWLIYGKTDTPKLASETALPMSTISRSEGLSTLTDSDIGNTAFDASFENSYQESRTQLADLGNGKRLLVYLEDNANKDIYNRTTLKYSVYNNGIFSKSQAVTVDGGYSDFYPNLYNDGENTYLTWQRSNKIFTQNDDLTEMAKAGEVWFAKFDADTDKFEEAVRVTNNNVMDAAPKFAIKENPSDSLSIFWQTNSNDDIMGLSGTNGVMYSTFNNGGFTEPASLYSVDGLMSNITAGYKNSELVCSVISDTDGDVTTLDDRKVIIVKDGAVYELAEGEVGHSQFSTVNNKLTLFYRDSGNIVSSSALITNKLAIGGMETDFGLGFNVVSNDNNVVIFYENGTENSKQCLAAVYNDSSDSWDKNILLAESEKGRLLYPTGFITETGAIGYAFNFVDENDNSVIVFDIKELNCGIEINDAYFIWDFSDGEESEISVAVKNTGDYDINKLVISMFGQQISLNLSEPLAVAETRYFDLIYTVRFGEGAIETISADAIVNGNTVFTSSYDLFYGYVDYELTAKLEKIDGKREVNISAGNLSPFEGSGVLLIYINGEVIDSFNINDSFNLNYTFEKLAKDDVIQIKIVPHVLEKDLSNNEYMFISTDDYAPVAGLFNPYKTYIQNARMVA